MYKLHHQWTLIKQNLCSHSWCWSWCPHSSLDSCHRSSSSALGLDTVSCLRLRLSPSPRSCQGYCWFPRCRSWTCLHQQVWGGCSLMTSSLFSLFRGLDRTNIKLSYFVRWWVTINWWNTFKTNLRIINCYNFLYGWCHQWTAPREKYLLISSLVDDTMIIRNQIIFSRNMRINTVLCWGNNNSLTASFSSCWSCYKRSWWWWWLSFWFCVVERMETFSVMKTSLSIQENLFDAFDVAFHRCSWLDLKAQAKNWKHKLQNISF